MPARNISMQYSLLAIPCKVTKAVEGKQSNTSLCVGQPGKKKHDATPITRPATCPKCDLITDFDVLKKGVKEGSTYAVINGDDIAEAKAEFTKQYKEAANFVAHPAADFYAKTAPGSMVNFATPAGKLDCRPGCRGCTVCRYALLVRLVDENPDVAFVAMYTPQSVTSVWVLTVRDGALVIEERIRTQELKLAPEIPEPAEFKDKLYDILAGSLEVIPYDPEDYEDKYAAAVRELAENAEHVVVATAGGTSKPAATLADDDDLVAKLQALAAATRKPAKKAPAKKATSRKKVA